MKRTKTFPFNKARRITSEEVRANRKAIEDLLGTKRTARLGRPPKADGEKYILISIRLHPAVLRWLKKQAKKQDVAYQTIINEILLREVREVQRR